MTSLGDQSCKPPKTEEFYQVQKTLPDRFNNPHVFDNYAKNPQHPMYRTSNNDYGNRVPTVHDMPTKYFAKCQVGLKFTSLANFFKFRKPFHPNYHSGTYLHHLRSANFQRHQLTVCVRKFSYLGRREIPRLNS